MMPYQYLVERKMDISAVVLSFNSKRYIRTCIESLAEAFKAAEVDGEIFVVDNGSLDGSVEELKLLEQQHSGVLNVIYLPENVGTTRSRNYAFKRACGEFILVLDSDAYMNPSALLSMVAYMTAHQHVGLVVPRLTYPCGRYQLSVDTFPTFWRKVERFRALKKIEASEPPLVSGAVDYAISAVWLLRASAVKRIGVLDERIFYSPEDVDYCIRVWKAGFQIHFLPQVAVVHDAQELSRPKGFRLNKFTLRHAKGLAYLFAKHRYFFSLNGLYRRIGRHSA